MNLSDLQKACPGVDFSVLYKPWDRSYSIEDYIIEFLPKTLEILKSTPLIRNSTIVEFALAFFKDKDLPFSEKSLIENLKCTPNFAQHWLEAQSSFLAVTFAPLEFKLIGPTEYIPFVVAHPQTELRSGGYGMVQKVYEGKMAFARKTIRDNDESLTMKREYTILRMATETGNPHLLNLRCAYQQGGHYCLVTYPWCELNLGKFVEYPFWTLRDAKSRLVLLSNWMACMASGLATLHQIKLKHHDLKPENVLFDGELMPVICDFGHSKAIENGSKSSSYSPPEQFQGKAGYTGDIFSLGLIFVELGLVFFGRKALKYQMRSGNFMDIASRLEEFLADNFPFGYSARMDGWTQSFRALLKDMLDESPSNRPKASEVWARLKEMVESIGGEPHCNQVPPVESIYNAEEEEDENEEAEMPQTENNAMLFE